MPTVFFDLDGTLVDTTYLHVLAWWQAFDDAGEELSMAEIHPLIGMGSSEILKTLLGRDVPSVSDAHGRHFANLHPLVRSLPGASGLVQRLVAEGGRAVIVTSAKARDLDVLLGVLGCDEEITDVVHGGDVERSKPAPDPFAVALDRTRADPSRSLAIGDSVWDVEAAAKTGLGCIGFQSGGIGRDDLLAAGAVAVYRNCGELMKDWSSSPLAVLLAPR